VRRAIKEKETPSDKDEDYKEIEEEISIGDNDDIEDYDDEISSGDGQSMEESDGDDENKEVDNVGSFINEVEGGVPCAPHLSSIRELLKINQTPSYQRSNIENEKIKLLVQNLTEMKLRGEISREVCGLGTCWTYGKKGIEKHRIGRIAGRQSSWMVFPQIICSGDTPSLSEVISAIKLTKNTKIGKEVSIIEMPGDVLEYFDIAPFAQNRKAFIASRFETLFGLKNENGELEMFHHGSCKKKKNKRRACLNIPRRLYVDWHIGLMWPSGEVTL
jgi:hypothetical protein